MSTISDRMLPIFLLSAQIIFLILFAALGEYDPATARPPDTGTSNNNAIEQLYPMFQDVHVMIFIGFGFLMTFLKKYGYSAVSLNLLLGAFVVQWHMLLNGFFHMHDGKFYVSVQEMILSEFCAGAILISFGACLGKMSPLQYGIMAFLETIFFVINEYAFEKLGINDVGGSMNLHMFGAYFGIVVALIHYNKQSSESTNEGAIYHSDIFSMIGTVFLWIFWPSFNAAIVTPADARNRALINTYFSLAACTVVAFCVSSIVDKHKRFNMVHIQNATLAGGVAIGTAANLYVTPFGSIVIGGIAGAVSVLGYTYLQPWLLEKIKLHDTCGVNNLHGMPGFLGGIVGIIMSALVDNDTYKGTEFEVMPAMNPALPHTYPGQPRSAGTQALYQLAGLVCALLICLIGGAITGLILKGVFCHKIESDTQYFNDVRYFETPDEEQNDINHQHSTEMK